MFIIEVRANFKSTGETVRSGYIGDECGQYSIHPYKTSAAKYSSRELAKSTVRAIRAKYADGCYTYHVRGV